MAALLGPPIAVVDLGIRAQSNFRWFTSTSDHIKAVDEVLVECADPEKRRKYLTRISRVPALEPRCPDFVDEAVTNDHGVRRGTECVLHFCLCALR